MSGKIVQCVYKIGINVLIIMSKEKIFKCGENVPFEMGKIPLTIGIYRSKAFFLIQGTKASLVK